MSNLLSSETWATIFSLASLQGHDSSLSNSAPWNLYQTCRLWRAICLANPNLWRSVAVRDNAHWNNRTSTLQLDRLRSRLSKQLELSRNHPLDIVIGTSQGEPMDSSIEELCMSVLWPYRESWGSLDLVVGVGSKKQWPRVACAEIGFPQLKSLEIAFTKDAVEAHTILSLFINAPALKQVSFHRPPSPIEHLQTKAFTAAGDDFRWPVLKTLCLINHGPDIFPNVLSNVNHITLLRLDCLGTTRKRHSYEPRTRPRMHIFPHLIGLSIAEDVDDALEELTAGPSLRSLDFGGRVSGMPLQHFLRRSKAKRIHSVDCEEVVCRNFDDALEEMPWLSFLCIQNIGVKALSSIANILAPNPPDEGRRLKPRNFPFPLLRYLVLHGVESDVDRKYPRSWDLSLKDRLHGSEDLDNKLLEWNYGETFSAFTRLLAIPYGVDCGFGDVAWPKDKSRILFARITVQNQHAWEDACDGESLTCLGEAASRGLDVDVGYRVNEPGDCLHAMFCLWPGQVLRYVPTHLSEVACALKGQ